MWWLLASGFPSVWFGDFGLMPGGDVVGDWWFPCVDLVVFWLAWLLG